MTNSPTELLELNKYLNNWLSGKSTRRFNTANTKARHQTYFQKIDLNVI